MIPEIVAFEPSAHISKADFEDHIDRYANGSPLLWPEGTDPEAVKKWRATHPQVSKRTASLRPKGGVKMTRTTTFIDCLDDGTALADYRRRLVVLGMGRSPGLVERAAKVKDVDDAEDKRELLAIATAADAAADSSYKSSMGTVVHAITEDIDQGIDPGFIEPDIEKDIEAYRQAMGEAGLEVVELETFSVCDELAVAGTFDRLVLHHAAPWCDHDAHVCRPKLRVADIKTGRVDYSVGKIARQLAIYAHMERYDAETFQRRPLTDLDIAVDQEVGLVIHLPLGTGTCEILELDIARGWQDVKLCTAVREYRSYWGRKDNQPKSICKVEIDPA